MGLFYLAGRLRYIGRHDEHAINHENRYVVTWYEQQPGRKHSKVLTLAEATALYHDLDQIVGRYAPRIWPEERWLAEQAALAHAGRALTS